MLAHTDAQIARLLTHLERLNVHDNTLIVLLSDNGASQEGGAGGCCNTVTHENGDTVTLEQNLAHFDEIGGPRCHTNYPWGWAQVGNTPLKRYKQNTHAGGVRAPLIVSWPRALAGFEGGVRSQFHHVIDITPTILDIVQTPMPDYYRGIAQMPMHGTSMRYTFDQPDAETRRQTQYFEMYGHRALWHDGWKAVAFHQRGSSYDDDIWELYHLGDDFSECNDMAQQRPDILHELIGRWWSEAERYQVFPLDDRNFAERAARYHSAASPRRRNSFVFYPGMTHIPNMVTPLIYDRSYRIDARVSMTSDDRGVLISQGDVNGGYVLYIDGGRLRYEYNHQGTRYKIASGPLLSTGNLTLSFEFQRTGDYAGLGRLLLDGTVIGEGAIASTAKYILGWQGLVIGRDARSPVSWDYPQNFEFTGTLHSVSYELAGCIDDVAYEAID